MSQGLPVRRGDFLRFAAAAPVASRYATCVWLSGGRGRPGASATANGEPQTQW